MHDKIQVAFIMNESVSHRHKNKQKSKGEAIEYESKG